MREDALIAALASDLTPTKPMWSPPVRAFAWVSVAVAFAAVILWVMGMDEWNMRVMEAPDLRYALAGSVLTAGMAALAAFELSVPGRSPWWLAAPVPPAVLWFAASGWGCLREWVWPGLAPATLMDSLSCAKSIALISAPLSALLLWMLSRACPLWPARVASMGGLAAAAAAASLLTLFHPYDASVVDLVMHMIMVSIVVGVCRVAGSRFSTV